MKYIFIRSSDNRNNNIIINYYNYCLVRIYTYIVNDCYRMASMCYNNSEFHCANEWFDEVFKKYEEDNSAAEFDYSTLIIQSVWSSYLVGGYSNMV